jgi:hypothetical protein
LISLSRSGENGGENKLSDYNKISSILDSLNDEQKKVYSVAVAQLFSPIFNELADGNTKVLFNKALSAAWKIILEAEDFRDNVLLSILKKRANLYIFEEADQDEFVGDDTEWDVSRIIGILVHFFELHFKLPTSIRTSAIASLSLGLFEEIDYYLDQNSTERVYHLEELQYQTELKILEIISNSTSLIAKQEIFKLTVDSNLKLSEMMPLILEKTDRWKDFEP